MGAFARRWTAARRGFLLIALCFYACFVDPKLMLGADCLTAGGCLIWWIVDIFTASARCDDHNPATLCGRRRRD